MVPRLDKAEQSDHTGLGHCVGGLTSSMQAVASCFLAFLGLVPAREEQRAEGSHIQAPSLDRE